MNRREANRLGCFVFGGTAAVLAILHRSYWQPHDYSNAGTVIVGMLIGVATKCWLDWELPDFFGDVEDDNVSD